MARETRTTCDVCGREVDKGDGVQLTLYSASAKEPFPSGDYDIHADCAKAPLKRFEQSLLPEARKF